MIKSLNNMKDIPIIAVTALAMKGDEKNIIGCGFDGYITKPMLANHLLKTIRHLLEWSQASGVL